MSRLRRGVAVTLFGMALLACALGGMEPDNVRAFVWVDLIALPAFVAAAGVGVFS